MALKSTIFKANLQIADIENSYYADHSLTLARHPSETDERMMVRLVVLALQAHKLQSVCNGDGTLAFGACGKADEVALYCFSSAAEVWWKGIQTKLTRPKNLSVWRIPTVQSQSLATLAQRSMQLQATVQEGQLTLGDEKTTVDIECIRWL